VSVIAGRCHHINHHIIDKTLRASQKENGPFCNSLYSNKKAKPRQRQYTFLLQPLEKSKILMPKTLENKKKKNTFVFSYRTPQKEYDDLYIL
jgi:hypothetical protein